MSARIIQPIDLMAWKGIFTLLFISFIFHQLHLLLAASFISYIFYQLHHSQATSFISYIIHQLCLKILSISKFIILDWPQRQLQCWQYWILQPRHFFGKWQLKHFATTALSTSTWERLSSHFTWARLAKLCM